MYKNRSCAPMLSLLLVMSSMTCTARDTSDRVCDAAMALGAGAVVVGIGAAIWSAFKPAKPEEVLSNACAICDAVKRSQAYYNAQKLQSCHVDLGNESLLYELAVAHVRSQCTDLSSLIAQVTEAQKAVRDAYGRTENYDLRYRLDEVLKDLRNLESQVSCLHNCLLRNSAYFDLYELEESLISYHGRELRHVSADCYACSREDIHTCLSLRASQQRGWTYPYLEYAKKIAADIKQLEKSIGRVGYTYVGRLHASQDLLAKLKAIHHLVITDHEYTASLRAYEHEQRERERLELERQRVALEQERVRVERARLQVERDRAWAEGLTRFCYVCGIRESVGCCHCCY